MGFYCPLGNFITPCPIATYSDLEFRSKTLTTFLIYSQHRPYQHHIVATVEDCSPCPAGYFCNDTAISVYTHWPCPVGAYCLIGSLSPTVCPNSSVSLLAGASALSNCTDCPAGFYCTDPSVSIRCPPGFFCPTSSSAPEPCPGIKQ